MVGSLSGIYVDAKIIRFEDDGRELFSEALLAYVSDDAQDQSSCLFFSLAAF